MIFDNDRNQFVLTVDDVIQKTNYTSDDILSHNIDLRMISQAVYRAMYNYYRGPNTTKQVEAINEIIENDVNKQKALLNAFIEFLHGAMVSGMDLNQYISSLTMRDRTQSIPDSVKDELRQGGLYFPGEIY